MVDRFTDAMNDRARQTNHEGLNEEIVNLLRLAALLHDVGHGTMSHVSENAMAYFEELDSLKKDFADEHSVETKIQLSGIAAFYLLRSPAFHELLQAAQETTNDHVLPQDAVQLISGIIVGQQIDPRIPLLQEQISGPFDADKLDYITRDATMAGVPIVTDVPRLVQKVRLQTLTEAELPKDIGEKIRGGFCTYLFTGVLSRSYLLVSIYLVVKKCAAQHQFIECPISRDGNMVASALIELAALLNVPPWQLVYQLSDEQLLNMSVEELRWRQGGSWAPDQDDRATLIVDLLARLRNRELLVRSYAFAQNMALDSYRADSAQRVGLMQVLGLDPTELRELAREIANEILNMRSLLKEGPFNSIAPESLSAYIWVDPPDSTNRRGGTPRAFLIPESGAPIRFRDESGETKGWADAYLSTRDIGFVFAPVEASSYAYLATEKLLRTRFGIRSPNSMLELAKHNAKELDALRRRLALAGFYDDLPLDLRPMPPDLLSVAGRRLVAETCQGLAQFEGIYREGFPHQTVEVSEERIIDWIRQFDDDFTADALVVAHNLRMLSRSDCVNALIEFLEKHPDYDGAYVCQFGSPGDSSSIVTYFAKDLDQSHGLTLLDLRSALVESDTRPLIFMDDFLGSGGQSVLILENWMGIAPSVDLGEDHGPPLSEPLRKLLKERKVAFVFAAGTENGAERLRDKANELELLDPTVFIGRDSKLLPRAFGDGVIQDLSREAEFKAACEGIGRQLLDDGDPKHNSQWITEKVLGYGNDGFLVLTPYNVPTATLTCLWAEGKVNGSPWLPLIPRRKKN